MAIKNFQDGVLTVSDGDAGPNTLELTFDGDVSIDMPGAAILPVKDRGNLPATPCFVRTSEEPCVISFTCKVQALSDAAAATAADLVNAEAGGGFIGTTWVSTQTVPGASKSLDVAFTDGSKTWTFPDCIIRGSFAEAEDGDVLSFTATCPHPYPTIT